MAASVPLRWSPLLALAVLRSPTAAGFGGSRACPCTTFGEGAGFHEALRASGAPRGYGQGECRAWDATPSRHCSRGSEEAYCFQQWCYISAADCRAEDIWAAARPSVYLNTTAVRYSYAGCGGTDLWSVDVYLVIQGGSPYWDRVAASLAGTFLGTRRWTYRPTNPSEERVVVRELVRGRGERRREGHGLALVVAPVRDHCAPADSRGCPSVKAGVFGQAYEPLLQARAHVIFLETGPSPPARAGAHVVVAPDHRSSGRLLGARFCRAAAPPRGAAPQERRLGPALQRELLVFTGSGGSCKQRVAGFLGAMAEACPTSLRRGAVHYVSAAWSYSAAFGEMSRLIKFQPRLAMDSAVLACNDQMGMGASDALVGAHGMPRNIVVSFDNDAGVVEYIRDGRILATVDQVGPSLRTGLPSVVLGLSSPFQILNSSVRVSSSVSVVTSNMEAYATETTLIGYVKSNPPTNRTVRAEIAKAQLIEFLANSRQFSMVLDLKLGWSDGRLTWDCAIAKSTNLLDSSSIWTPDDVFEEMIAAPVVVVPPSVTVSCHGEVLLTKSLLVKFVCDFDRHLRDFPFDTHVCPAVWREGAGFEFRASGQGDKMSRMRDIYFEMVEMNGGSGAFHIEFTFYRDLDQFYGGFLLGLAFINMVGLLQLWIPVSKGFDRAGLAATVILSVCLLRRETIDLPLCQSWVDVIWASMFLFQVVALAFSIFGSKTDGHSHAHRPMTCGQRLVGTFTGSTSDTQLDLIGKRLLVPTFAVFVLSFNRAATAYLSSRKQPRSLPFMYAHMMLDLPAAVYVATYLFSVGSIFLRRDEVIMATTFRASELEEADASASSALSIAKAFFMPRRSGNRFMSFVTSLSSKDSGADGRSGPSLAPAGFQGPARLRWQEQPYGSEEAAVQLHGAPGLGAGCGGAPRGRGSCSRATSPRSGSSPRSAAAAADCAPRAGADAEAGLPAPVPGLSARQAAVSILV